MFPINKKFLRLYYFEKMRGTGRTGRLDWWMDGWMDEGTAG